MGRQASKPLLQQHAKRLHLIVHSEGAQVPDNQLAKRLYPQDIGELDFPPQDPEGLEGTVYDVASKLSNPLDDVYLEVSPDELDDEKQKEQLISQAVQELYFGYCDNFYRL